MKFKKGTADQEQADNKKVVSSIDYRVRCLVRNGPFDRLYYGITALEYVAGSASDGSEVYDVRDVFDHSAGRGHLPGRPTLERPVRFFYTQGLGRHDEIKALDARKGVVRR
jgi:hypothetical protein